MDRRSFCKVLGFAAGSTLLPGLMVQAAGQGSVGHAVPDGRYTIGIRSDLSGCDLTHTFYYSDSFFTHPATQYDHQLALATLGLVCAAANTIASDAEYWVNGSVGREAHIAAAYEALGFEDALFYNYDLDTGRAGDFVGYSLARKTLTLNGQRTTLVALILRGGGYGGEWVSNLHTGVGAGHAGFVIPVNEVLTALRNYLARAAAQPGGTGTVKLWVGGYSRGAAVANLLAGRINKELPEIDRKNVFVYTFATPVALTAASYPDYQLDYDNNHNADGTLKTTWAASNIYNILSSGDLVPRVLPAEWGYHRNGNDRFLPSTQNEKELADLDVRGASFSEVPLTISGLATKEDTDGVMERLETFFGSKQQFHDKYEAVLMDMIQCAFLRNEAECTEGYLLTDEEVEAAARLANAHDFIMRLPKGYDTMLEGDGSGLSQGQRQLISIARAACENAPVMILDEATSSIDTRTENLIEQGMDSLMEGRTVFVIAHRLSTVRNSQAILVLEHGRIIERGDHQELLAQKGKYYQLYTGKAELS